MPSVWTLNNPNRIWICWHSTCLHTICGLFCYFRDKIFQECQRRMSFLLLYFSHCSIYFKWENRPILLKLISPNLKWKFYSKSKFNHFFGYFSLVKKGLFLPMATVEYVFFNWFSSGKQKKKQQKSFLGKVVD